MSVQQAAWKLGGDRLSGERHGEELVGSFHTKGSSSGSVLEDVLGNKLDGQHGLSTGWLYLRFRKEKAKSAFVSELEGKCVFDAQVVSPV